MDDPKPDPLPVIDYRSAVPLPPTVIDHKPDPRAGFKFRVGLGIGLGLVGGGSGVSILIGGGGGSFGPGFALAATLGLTLLVGLVLLGDRSTRMAGAGVLVAFGVAALVAGSYCGP